eukprot:gnl/MRDRNA2_/MRDRNA2_143031_c0_seq1.p1 gnl/MRDRNA2_/MRDRNA2_143031_c0~~gnl/MRDRNA2_/MRDRNA2_143031_c0_seq1.p1  ORF type:complete len:170 (-),score=29.43 gnl/MRDRNA2_/MRDRNA2_143031_c0_seq1:596-1045(-)
MATPTCCDPLRVVSTAFRCFLLWKRPRDKRKVAKEDSRKAEAQAEREKVIRICKNVPPPPVDTSSPFRSFAFGLGLGGSSIQVPPGIKSLHDMAARLITASELSRLRKCKQEMLGFEIPRVVLNGGTERCFPFSALRGRCVLIVNTASK